MGFVSPALDFAPSARRSKRPVGERAAAAAALVASSPILAAAALGVVFLSRRSPFIAHLRIGQYGRPFWMFKLRTMWPNGNCPGASLNWIEFLDDGSGPEGKSPSDERVTSRFATFCRRHSIDELPQFLHVLTGDMAWVGPRPVTAGELLRHYGPAADEVLQVKPGLTGLWQVCGRSRLSYAERRRLDLYLVRNSSLALSARILWRSLTAVLTGRDAW